jgi:transposase
MTLKRIGIDLAKNVFQVHGVDERGRTVIRRRLKRSELLSFFAQLPACLVGIEACGSAHHWARQLQALGHEVRLMAPRFVTPYRKNDKNDGNDAEAVCEAVGRSNMRFVPIKDEQQQAVLGIHRARELLVGQRTALINQIRGLLSEYGIVVGQGAGRLRTALPAILEDAENGLPELARELFAALGERLREFDEQVEAYDRRIERLARQMEPAQRLMRIEGVGPLTATAIVASVGNARVFNNGRQFAAWLGLVPRQYSSGGKTRHGRITKRGDGYLRKLLIHGARALMRHLQGRDDPRSRWVLTLKARRGFNKALIALAAKNARVLWAVLAREQAYRPAQSGA